MRKNDWNSYPRQENNSMPQIPPQQPQAPQYQQQYRNNPQYHHEQGQSRQPYAITMQPQPPMVAYQGQPPEYFPPVQQYIGQSGIPLETLQILEPHDKLLIESLGQS